MRKMSAAFAPVRPPLGRMSRLRGEMAMDPLFCAGLSLIGKSAIRRASLAATASSGAFRLLLALAVIAAIVGALAHASAVSPGNLASTGSRSGETQ